MPSSEPQPTGQMHVGGIFVEHSHEISQCIRKNVTMKFRGIFRNNVSGILNTGIFPDCSMDILRMLHAFF